jgi:hypothetical protein
MDNTNPRKMALPDIYRSTTYSSYKIKFKPLKEDIGEKTTQPTSLVKTAHAEPNKPVKIESSTDCEQYRDKVAVYFGEYTDQALFVAQKESSCQNIRSHKQNKNGTYDYCIFQINNEPNALDIDTCIRRAWEKFKGANYTWRPWYAVCAIGGVSKFPQIIKCK